MKTRSGFVSNSSSTSFCVYGAHFNEEREFLKSFQVNSPELFENFINKCDEEWRAELRGEVDDDDCQGALCEWQSELEESIDSSIAIGVGECDILVGVPCTEFRDDETGAQFKERYKKVMRDTFGVDAKHILEEC